MEPRIREIYRRTLPAGYEIVFVDSSEVIEYGGAVHCVTMGFQTGRVRAGGGAEPAPEPEPEPQPEPEPDSPTPHHLCATPWKTAISTVSSNAALQIQVAWISVRAGTGPSTEGAGGPPEQPARTSPVASSRRAAAARRSARWDSVVGGGAKGRVGN